MMLALALAFMSVIWVPGADDPVCEPGQVIEIDHCSQGQLPEEVVGRQTTDENGVNWVVVEVDSNGNQVLQQVQPLVLENEAEAITPVDIPVAVASPVETIVDTYVAPEVLASTGVPSAPYAIFAGGLLLIGASLIKVSRLEKAHI